MTANLLTIALLILCALVLHAIDKTEAHFERRDGK